MVIAGALALPAAAAATTPPVSESFSPGSVAAGGITTLTFTIDNSQDSLPHSISFDDQLPAGIHLVGTPSAANCIGAPVGETAEESFTGSVRLTLKPSARGRQEIQRRHRQRLTVTVGYTPTGGTQRTTRLTLSLT